MTEYQKTVESIVLSLIQHREFDIDNVLQSPDVCSDVLINFANILAVKIHSAKND